MIKYYCDKCDQEIVDSEIGKEYKLILHCNYEDIYTSSRMNLCKQCREEFDNRIKHILD